MSDFVAFLVFIFRVIQFVLELVLDIVLFALYCVGLAAVWRLPWNLQALGKCNSRSDYRFTCLLSFGTLLLDLVCLPLGFASLAAFWRWPWSVPLFFAVDMSEEYDAEVRLHLFANFFIMLGDLLVLPFVALSTVSLIHIPDLLDAIKEALGESDSDLCYSADLRWTIVALGLGSLIDILFVPTFLIALLSWRHSEVWQEVKEHTGWERRLVGIFFFFTLLVDILFFVLIIFLTCTLWRAGPLWRELRECKDLDSIRKPTMRQLALFFRDMPFVLLFFVLVGTLWRAINTIARVFGLFRPMSLSPEPAVMQVESCRFEFPEAGGARIHYRCRKPVDFALAPGAQVKLYVVDASGSFWTKAETVLGSAAAIVAKNMLPLSLAGTYLDPAVLEQAGGEDTVEFTVLFNQAVKRSTIVKKLRAIGAPEFLIHLQAEDSASLRTLASVRTSGTAIIESAEHDQPLASVGSDLHVTVAAFAQAQEDAEWRDSFIVIVGMNFVQLMLDLIYLVMFALCAIAPWRLLVCMYLLTEHKDIWPLRVRQKMVQMVAMTRTIHADMRDAIVNRSHLALKFYRPRVVLQNPGVINQLWSAFKRTVSNSSGSHASHVHDPDWPFGVTYPEHYVPETDRRKHDIEGAFLNLDHAVSEGDIFFSYGGVYSLVAEALEAGAEKLQRKKPEDLSAFTEPPQPSHLAPSEEAAPERERHVLELMEVTEMGSVAPVEGLVAELEAAGQEPVGILDSSELINSHNRAENVLAYLFILEHQLAKAFRNETITRRTYDAFQATVVGAQVRARARLDALSRAVEHRFGEIAALTAGCHFSCKHMFTRSTSQYRKIVAAMFQGALFDIFSIVFFFVNIGLLYRAGDMIRAWRRASVWEWKRIEVLRVGFEYLQDLVFVIESVVIFGTLFSAIDFMVDLAGCANTPDRRRTGHRYFVGVFSDLWRWFTMLFSLRLFTYAIASTVFGFLVPAATVNELLVGSVHSKFWRRLSAITIWFGFLLYPIIVIQDIIPSMAEDLGDVVSGPLSLAADTPVFSNSNVDKISALVAVYFGLLFAVVVGSVVLASQREEFKSVYQPSKTVSTSAPNVFVIFYILFDALQLSSVAWAVFAFNQTPVEFQNDSENDSASPTFGSMKAISAAVLFFEEGSFIIIISIALALVGLWYLVISTPTVIEEFFDGEKGAITESAGWKYTVGLLGNTLYLSIVFSLFKALQCRYTTVNPGAAGTEYKVGVLHGDADEVCWDLDEKQAALATASLVLVAFYLFTSHLFATESNALNVTANEELDIRFPIVDQLAVNTAKILISGCILLFPTKPWVMLSLVLAGGAFLYLWTASYERIFGTPVCHIAWVTTFRMGIYVTVMWSAICAMLEQRRRDTNGDEVKVDTVLMFFVGVGVIVFFTFLPIWWRRRKARIEREKAMAAAGIKDAIEQLVAIEADMFEAGALVPAWAKLRERWRSQMENIKRPLSMAHRVMELERHTRVRALSRAFLNYRIMWIMGQLNPGLVNWSTLSSALPDSAAADASWAGPMFPKGHVLRNNVIVPSASSNTPAEFARGRPLDLDEVASAIQCYVKSLRRIESQPFPGMDELSSDMRPMDAQIGSARQNWVGQMSGLASTIVDAAAFRAQERVRANNGDESARARIAEARSVLQAGASALASAGKQWIVGRFGGNDGADEDMDEVRIEEPAPLPAEPAGKWACSGCTFLNEPATTNCAMCDTRRG